MNKDTDTTPSTMFPNLLRFIEVLLSKLNKVSFLGSSMHHVSVRQINLNSNLMVVRSSLRDSKFNCNAEKCLSLNLLNLLLLPQQRKRLSLSDLNYQICFYLGRWY